MAPSSNDCRSAKLPQGNLRHANRLFKTRVVARNVCMLQLSELAKDGGRDSYGANQAQTVMSFDVIAFLRR